MDEDIYPFIVDRKRGFILPGSFRVWPRKVEDELATHLPVAEAIAAGVPDECQRGWSRQVCRPQL